MMPVVNYSNSTTAEAARTAPDPATHPPKDPRCTLTAAAQQGRIAAVRELVDADVIMMLRRVGVPVFFL